MRFLKGIILSFLIVSSFAAGIFFYLLTNLPIHFSSLENYDPGTASIVLDDQGTIITRFQLDRRDTIPFNRLSPHIIQAFLAAEDQHFFLHHGISIKSIIRSFIANFYRGKIVQGASTITQQLVKLLFLDNKRTFKRKIKEFFMALIIEAHFSKEQILETYLNHIYLGCGIYGTEAACKRFWNVSSCGVTIAQAAALAGIVQSPERLCPLIYPEKTLARRDIILKRMLKQKRITDDDYVKACQEQLSLYPGDDECYALHIKEMIRQLVENQIGKKELYSGGLVIQTTLSYSLQKEALHALKTHLERHEKKSIVSLDGGIIVMQGASGKIKALVGGKSFKESQFNRVTQARRQLGSIFKPLIFATALEHGASMADICNDEAITIVSHDVPWTPRNYNHTFKGPVTRAYGLYKSLNTIAIQTLYTAGIENSIATARKCGLTQDMAPYPSLALGCVDATLWQAARMFNCFAQQGLLIEPYYIEWIKNKHGKKIYKHTHQSQQALDWIIASQITATLCAGTTQLLKKNPYDPSLKKLAPLSLMTKTGTTNDARNCFCIAATPDITVAAFMGNDDNKPMGKSIFASQTVRPLIVDILSKMAHTPKHFVNHPDLRPVIIHEITGTPLIHKDDPHAIEILVPNQSKK